MRKPMAPSRDPATFVETIGLQEVISPSDIEINDADGGRKRRRVFKSTGPAFVPIDGVYGGHLLAQSVYAAYKTVDQKFYCNNITTHFLIGGKPKLPFVYTVESVREGKSYCIRYVQARQPSADQQQRPLDADIIFVATVSYKTVELPGLESQLPPPLELKSWLSNPQRHEVAPAVDVPSWIDFTVRKGIRPKCMGIDIRKVDVEESNRSKPTHEHRKVQIYKPIGVLTPEEESCLSICAHVYASDRNGMFAVTSPHNASDHITQTGSLSHTLVFHANPKKLLFPPKSISNSDDPSSWAVLEQFGDSASEGRGLIRSRLWAADGTLLASAMQDALVRVRLDDEGNSPHAFTGKIDKRKVTFSEKLKSML